MNITYILGNGFDLNFEMCTKYEHFYDYYKNQPCDEDCVVDLKNRMFKELENKKNQIDWSDLEWQLGLFTKRSEASVEDFDLFVSDLCKHLMDFLKVQNELFNPPENERNLLTNRFGAPALFLRDGNRTEVIDYINSFEGKKRINILTFNYTDVVERIVHKYMPVLQKGAMINSNVYYAPIHIHNGLNELTLGVNDKSQIAGEKFRNDSNFVSSFVKPELISECKSGSHMQAKEVINATDLFVIFGASLGKTDKLWAEEIGKSMVNNDSMLIYFSYQGELTPEKHRNKPRTKKTILAKLKNVMEVSDKEFESIQNRIVIDFNEKRLFGDYKVKQPDSGVTF